VVIAFAPDRSDRDRAQSDARDLVASVRRERASESSTSVLTAARSVRESPRSANPRGAAVSAIRPRYPSASGTSKRTGTSSVRMSENPAASSSAVVRSALAVLKTGDPEARAAAGSAISM
jgi:hypothetical protein